MSSTPERDASGRWGGTQSGPRGMPEHEQFGSVPPGGGHGGESGAPYGSYWDGGSQAWTGPVSPDETSVVGRRVIQYIIDYILAGIIPGLAYWLLDRGSGVLHGFGWALATLIALAVYLWYWVIRPYGHGGQTFGMQLLGIRVISKTGGPASMLQYLVRGVLLLVDTLLFGLVGLVTMMMSRYHQRVGDHVARTLVVAAASPGVMGMGRGGRFEHADASGAADERLAHGDMYADPWYDHGTATEPKAAGPGATGPADQQ